LKYISLNHNSAPTSFKKAVINGLAPDKGLYFPEKNVKLPVSFVESLKSLNDVEICYEVIRSYIGDEIPKNKLLEIIKDTISFKIPLKKIEQSIYSLELFHGPTLAFKDIGAKFMASCLNYFKDSYTSKKITVLVATSGDTGGAVAKGFSNTKDIDVCILYPKGKISEVQKKQITTNGSYVNAIEVEGDFDLCQSMVKKAFNDEEINRNIALTSANSINVARWLPQMFYYFLAYKKINNKRNVFSVPSGNFGNICAGILAKSMGLPIDHFIAATNINDTIPRYIKEGIFEPNNTYPTISNAMDVSNPSNFVRIQKIYNNDLQKIRKNISGFSYDDKTTKQAIKKLFTSENYLTDPHSAIGYLGLKEYMGSKNDDTLNGIFISTAHSIKFKDVVEDTISSKIKYPASIKNILNKESNYQSIGSYSELKEILLNRN
jgi:threonine synthase